MVKTALCLVDLALTETLVTLLTGSVQEDVGKVGQEVNAKHVSIQNRTQSYTLLKTKSVVVVRISDI